MDKKQLSDLYIGQKGIVVQHEDHPAKLKLMEMGIREGELVEVVNKAPFGGPIAIAVVGYTLSIRLDDAQFIWIK